VRDDPVARAPRQQLRARDPVKRARRPVAKDRVHQLEVHGARDRFVPVSNIPAFSVLALKALIDSSMVSVSPDVDREGD
jgi:hypothetical protein